MQKFIVFLYIILAINNDKSVNLHTRGLKYGKIEDGLLIKVNHYLIVK